MSRVVDNTRYPGRRQQSSLRVVLNVDIISVFTESFGFPEIITVFREKTKSFSPEKNEFFSYSGKR